VRRARAACESERELRLEHGVLARVDDDARAQLCCWSVGLEAQAEVPEVQLGADLHPAPDNTSFRLTFATFPDASAP
jgi:hypothetical protein